MKEKENIFFIFISQVYHFSSLGSEMNSLSHVGCNKCQNNAQFSTHVRPEHLEILFLSSSQLANLICGGDSFKSLVKSMTHFFSIHLYKKKSKKNKINLFMKLSKPYLNFVKAFKKFEVERKFTLIWSLCKETRNFTEFQIQH